jgi:hypothetical protein
VVIMSLLGGTAGQAVVWYTGQFYALFFLLQMLKIDPQTANLLIAGSLLIGTPFFIIFGSLSDRIGRKPIIMAGCILAALTYFPIFKALTEYGNPDVFVAQEQNPVVVVADPASVRSSSTRWARPNSPAPATWPRACWPSAPSPTKTRPPSPAAWPGAHWRAGVAQLRRQQPGGGRLQGAERRLHRTLGTALKEAGYPEKPTRRRSTTRWCAAADHPGDLRDHGLRADRRLAGGAVPGAHPLHLDVAAVPHRQWLVRRLPADRGAMVAATGDIYYGSGTRS